MHKVKRFVSVAVLSACVLVCGGWAHGAEANAAVPFPVASVHLEQNITDGDMEVVFEVKGDKDGLAELLVISPDGRPVVAFKAPDASTLGMRQFRFESPEPRDIKALQAAYPEGVYAFSGKMSSGAKLVGQSTLSHRLPAGATVVKPAPSAKQVAVKDLGIVWSAVEGVASYVVSIKQKELNMHLTALLPSASTSFPVPPSLLLPGKTYDLAVGTVTREGNISYVETTFTTEK